MVTHGSDTKRELILKTARDVFARNGFAKTTLDDIANALGMNKSSLYYYYTNKEALIDDVIKTEREKFCSLINQAMENAGTVQDRLINYEKSKTNYVKETIRIYEITTTIFLELKQKLFEHIKAIQEKEHQMIKAILDEGIKKHEIKKCDTNKVAELIQTISEAFRHRELYFASFTLDKKINFDKAFDDMVFTLKLIFEGLATNK